MIAKIKNILGRIWPHLAIIAGFALVSAIYFMPVLEGKELHQTDNLNAIGAAQELKQYEQATGEQAQWTDSMFGGMPAYQIKGDASKNVFHALSKWVRFGLPYTTIAILFLYMLGFYLLMVSLKMNKWVAVAGALGFALGSYNLIIIVAGHITKAYAIAIMPTVIAGVILTLNSSNLKERIVGGAYTAVALGIEVAYNHVQITYYLVLAMIPLVVAKLIYAKKDQKLADYWKNMSVLCIASMLAVLPGLTNLWTTYEYGKYSIRGASELTQNSDGSQTPANETGLEREYAFSWSYGKKETPTLLIPNVVGGASQAMGYDVKAVQRINDNQMRDMVARQTSQYWGGRRFTSGPVYVGAVICFLFFLGLFYYNGREKWWIVAATILSILLAWGKNFAVFNDLMFDYFPLYNKFRTVEMALVIATVTIPLLGMLGLKELWDNPERVKYETGKFFGAMGLTAGVALLIAIAPTIFYDFLSEEEIADFARAAKEQPIYEVLKQHIIDARVELTRNDAMRSAIFIILASSALWFFSIRKINGKIAMSTIILLIVIDMWQVDKRYLGADNFENGSVKREIFTMSEADKYILADKEPHRVAAVYGSTFNDAVTSYFHQSIGGYHGAKLRRYQDVIDRYLHVELSMLIESIRRQDYEAIGNTLASAQIMNMLNTKYVIYNPSAKPMLNPYAMGAAWFVDDVKSVKSADEAIMALGSEDVSRVAIIEGCDAQSNADSTAIIRRVKYAPDALEYESKSAKDAVAVFSEIYYDKGWKAYIDDKEAEIMHADYILRALSIPAGEHKVRFEFKPDSYVIGNIISGTASVIVVLLIIGAIVVAVKSYNVEEPTPAKADAKPAKK